MAATPKPLTLLDCFADLEDPRLDRTQRHHLLDIVVIAVCAITGGAEGWTDVEAWAESKHDWLKTFLELPNGIPSHDTFGRVFARLDPVALQDRCVRWLTAASTALDRPHLALDGKTVRGAFRDATGQPALHLVSAWATAQRLALGQVAVDAKSNEITALPELLDLLELHGAIVTIDAMGCQTAIAGQIRDRGGDYVLAVKANQGHLYEDVRASFVTALGADGAAALDPAPAQEGVSHGRGERRRCWVLTDLTGIRDAARWPGLAALVLVVRERVTAAGRSVEPRFYIGSRAGTAAEYAQVIRDHWGIENRLHWVLDVVFAEDRCRVGADHGAANLAWLRRVAVSLLSQVGGRGSLRGKRLRAGWNNDYLLKVLCAGVKK